MKEYKLKINSDNLDTELFLEIPPELSLIYKRIEN